MPSGPQKTTELLSTRVHAAPVERRGRLTIGLYNSYDPTRFAEAHRRALARAGTVAWAFDANLVAFGFPFKDLATRVEEELDVGRPGRIADWVADSTTIGSEGKHFITLAQEGRFHVEDHPKRGFPPQYGTTVLATSRVPREENTPVRVLVELLQSGRPLLLVIGLGPHGTPKRIEKHAKHRWDLTGKGISMETCTAIGAAPAILHAHMDHLDRDASSGPNTSTGPKEQSPP